jgi:DNA topoisomerase-2
MRGTYRVVNTSTVEITELPPSMTFQKYDSHLTSLLERGVINSYEDNSSNGIHYTLKFTRTGLTDLINKGKLDQALKMIETETENLTCLDEHGKLIIFDSVDDLVKHFVCFRLGFYQKRKDYLIQKYNSDLLYISNRARFIKAIIEKILVISNRPNSEIVEDLKQKGFDEINGSYGYLLGMRIASLTKELYEELLKELESIKKLISETESIEPIDMYRADLTELKKNLTKNIKE